MESDFNDHRQAHEKEWKDETKKRREGGPAALDSKCEEPGWVSVGQTKAGLVNHIRQWHGSMVMAMKGVFLCQGCP